MNKHNKPSAVYKKDKKRSGFGISSLLWILVGALIAVTAAAFLYLSPLFADLRQAPADIATEQPVQPITPTTNEGSAVEFEFYEVLPEQDFRSTADGVSVQTPKEVITPIAKPDTVVRAKPADSTKKDEAIKKDTAAESDKSSDKSSDITVVEDNSTYEEDDKATTYILQIRSYPNADDADVKRAEVLMAGVDAVVVRRDDAEQGTHFYQVISTPMSKDAATAAQARLSSNGIDALLVEQKR